MCHSNVPSIHDYSNADIIDIMDKRKRKDTCNLYEQIGCSWLHNSKDDDIEKSIVSIVPRP